ncbi:sodium:calcium antiporter [Phytohalomonas tamaricis]|uniref:sodium:calcium antiporter n=1 Tax=Phytohalomonas tamaricis TaxID=2081032 RepID=UPI0021D42CC1|nr:sodium:calcium antiporter [Phytohalomonas tamaricis]
MLPDFSAMSLPLAIGLFLFCALVIGTAGTYLAGVADRLADRTGLGEAIAGSLLLGATTSLPGIVVSVSSAWRGLPELAMSNALGGIAVQTAFLALADVTYRRANLEHAAPSIGNLMQSGLLICLLALLLVGVYTPPVTIFGVHPVTPLLFAGYIYGLFKVRGAQEDPMWAPTQTRETFADEPEEASSHESLSGLWVRFALLALVLAVTGLVLERTATVIANDTGLSATAVGALLTAIATSLPELVTSIAAVRRGALTMAVSGIIGGNAFDTLFAAASDIAYRDGSIYHVVSDHVLLWIAITIVMTSVLVLGLIRREEQNWGGIGFESVLILALYGLGAALVMV